MSQQMPEEDLHLFYKLHPALLFYVNKEEKVVDGDFESPDEFRALCDLDDVAILQEKLYGNAQVIDAFVKDNPFSFSLDELEIVRSWKQCVFGKFMVIKVLKKHALFLNEDEDGNQSYIYAVRSLTDPFEDVFHMRPPVYLRAALLPFKGYIIYDGILMHHNVYFGGNMRRELNEIYAQAKLEGTIVTSFANQDQEPVETDEEKMIRYMKSQKSREHFMKEIVSLSRKNDALEMLYYQLLGKVSARTLKKDLSKRGIEKGWFGVLGTINIGCGETKKEAEKIITKIIPAKKRDHVYYFQMKKSKNV